MILAIRTDNPKVELYILGIDGKELRAKKWEAGYSLSKQILGEIVKLLKVTNIEQSDLTGVVVFEGPGSFTGLRIGISVANAMAYGLGIPVVASGGSNWVKIGMSKLADAKAGNYVIPNYGKEPNITQQRK